MKRSAFLLGSVSGLAIVSHVASPWNAALADTLQLPSHNDRVLVIVNMQGGNDGLNTVIPYTSEAYYRYRPTLGIPAHDVLTLNERIGLNPTMTSLKAMYDRGQVAIIEGVGYPQPDHSHFRSTEIWQTAAPERLERTGWLGRYLDEAHLPDDNLFNAAALSDVLPEVMIANRTDVPVISAIKNYGLTSDRQKDQRAALSAIVNDRSLSFRSPYLPYITKIEAQAQRGSEELPNLIAGYHPAAQYPGTNIGRSLALAAQMIGSRLGTRVIYVQHGSFDTHVAQRGVQDRLLRELSDALSAFYKDLAAHGNDQRTLTMTFSEFGRRVTENASRGTDHGEAAPLFLVGPVHGGIYGTPPSLDALNNGNLGFTTDFRNVYATVLDQWMGVASHPILGQHYSPIPGLFGGNRKILGMLET